MSDDAELSADIAPPAAHRMARLWVELDPRASLEDQLYEDQSTERTDPRWLEWLGKIAR